MSESIYVLMIDAYVDNELDPIQRLAIEEYLSHSPTLAARVMTDFRNRSALQLLARQDSIPPKILFDLIKRIRMQGKFSRLSLFIRLAATAVVVALIPLVGNMTSSRPSYIELAAATHRSVQERVVFLSHETISDRTKILLSFSRIAIPKLPSDWRVIDAELLQQADVPALLLAVRTREGRTLSIFAIRERSSAPHDPDTVREGREWVAYWRKGDFSYALVGDSDPRQIDATADALADSWRA